ncbi:MAG TPA: transposase [Candidatus Acidoferrum sp.]|jgi:putative transposase
MPGNLKRHYEKGHLHFVTFSCYQRRPLLAVATARDVFVETLGAMRARHGFRLVGYVVMPEHVHMLIGEPPEVTPSVMLMALKANVSRKLLGECGGSRRFWQSRFYDFNVYSGYKKREKLQYMHGNPVKRGLVTNPGDWMWSSFLFYEKGEVGLVPIDVVD